MEKFPGGNGVKRNEKSGGRDAKTRAHRRRKTKINGGGGQSEPGGCIVSAYQTSILGQKMDPNLEIYPKFLFCFRVREEEEILALAEQLNSRLDKTHDSVDLDNLFAFLTDVQSGRNPIIDQIGEKMKELVTDIDMEVKSIVIFFFSVQECRIFPNSGLKCRHNLLKTFETPQNLSQFFLTFIKILPKNVKVFKIFSHNFR